MTYLRITDAGKMASGNVAKATKELDGFCQKGQSLDRRPPSASTMNRLINMRTLSYIVRSTEAIHLIVKKCNCGLEFSGDMSAIMRNEVFVSAFTVFWSDLSEPDDRDIDGDRKPFYFSSVFEDPPISLAGKDALTTDGLVKELFHRSRVCSCRHNSGEFCCFSQSRIMPSCECARRSEIRKFRRPSLYERN